MNLNRYYQMRASETTVHKPLEDYTESDSEFLDRRPDVYNIFAKCVIHIKSFQTVS